jgi:hypothetical protein
MVMVCLNGEELNNWITNLLAADTDGGSRSDVDEVKVNRTNPNDMDTDGEALSHDEDVNN